MASGAGFERVSAARSDHSSHVSMPVAKRSAGPRSSIAVAKKAGGVVSPPAWNSFRKAKRERRARALLLAGWLCLVAGSLLWLALLLRRSLFFGHVTLQGSKLLNKSAIGS